MEVPEHRTTKTNDGQSISAALKSSVTQEFINCPFQYIPLDHNRSEIRLLRLTGATDRSQTISCKLIHVALGDDPAYEALSYVWGNAERTNSILLNGTGFQITKNLHDALRVLRLPGAHRDLWVDAICINQDDIPERNQQVTCMMSIYKHAQRVVVWLGEASNDTGLALEHLSDLSQQWHIAHPKGYFAICTQYMLSIARTMALFITLLWQAARMNAPHAFAAALGVVFYILVGNFPGIKTLFLYPAWLIFAMFRIWQKISDAEIPGPPCSTETIQALKNFFNRAWFRRTWIIQEIGASQDATFMCGAREIPWASLRTASSQIEHLINLHPRRSPYLDSGFQALAFMSSVLDVKIDHVRGAEMKRSLLYLMTAFSYFEATNPRDKVYGLFGLSNDARRQISSQHHLEIDYAKSTASVYAEVVRYMVESTGCLDVLRACLGVGKVAGLPSWVPDWTVSQTRSVSGVVYWRKPFRVTNDNKPKEPVALFSEDLSVMYTQGFVIGRLSNDGQVFPLPSTSTASDDGPQKPNIQLLPAFASYIIVPLLLIILRSWGVYYLLRFLARCDPAGLGFIFENISWMGEVRGWVFPRTMDAYATHMNVTDRETPILTHFTFEAVPELWWNAKTCNTYAQARYGDYVCIFLGAKVPFLCRGEEGRVCLVGPATLGGAVIDSLIWNDTLRHYKEGRQKLLTFALA